MTSANKQLLGRRQAPAPPHKHLALTHRLPFSTGRFLVPCLIPSRQKVCGAGRHNRQHLCPEHNPQGSQCLAVPSSPLSEPGSRQVRGAVDASVYVCPAVPALTESRSQPSPLCPAVEAEPACFWLPYMNH